MNERRDLPIFLLALLLVGPNFAQAQVDKEAGKPAAAVAARPATEAQLADLRAVVASQVQSIRQQAQLIQVLQAQLALQGEQLQRVQKALENSEVKGRTAELEAERTRDGSLSGQPVLLGAKVQAEPADTEVPAPSFPKIKIGGQYRVMGNLNNFGFHPSTISDDQSRESFFNQRFRTWLDITASENVGAYLQLEVGHIFWGQNFELTKSYRGPLSSMGDRVGIELRRAFLTYQRENLGLFRFGIQDWDDTFGSVLASADWDFNVGGVNFSRRVGQTTIRLGGFVLGNGPIAKLSGDAILFAGDVERKLGTESALGLAVYGLRDRSGYSYPIVSYRSAWDYWVGANFRTRLGSFPLHTFFIFNHGQRNDPDLSHRGFATKVELSRKLGAAEVGFQGLYSSGEDDPTATRSNEFRTIGQSERDNFGSQSYWSYLAITSPHGPSDVSDLGVSLQNRGLGLTTLQGRLRFPILERLDGTIAAGWLRSSATNPVSGHSYMGTELLGSVTVDLGGGLKIDLGSAFLWTGRFYQPNPTAPKPGNLFQPFTRIQLEY